MALGRGWEEGREGPVGQDWFLQQPSSQLPKPPTWHPRLPRPPWGLLYVQEASGQPIATGRKGGQKKDFPLDVCPGSNSQYPLNGDPWPCPALTPILTPPNTQTQILPPPNSCRQTRGVAPNLLALLPLSQAGQRVVKGKEDTQVALLSDFHSRATVPLLTHRSPILPPHLPPPTPPGRGSPTSRRGRFFN